jgi:hypothetical protein
MISSKNRFMTLCKNDESFPKFTSYHSVINLEVLSSEFLPFKHDLDTVTKVSIIAAP